MTKPPLWYVQCLTALNAFAALLIVSVYLRGGDKASHVGRPAPDRAFPWFAGALATWALTGLGLLLVYGSRSAEQLLFYRLLASPLNSVFLLMALRYFNHSPEWVQSISELWWYGIVGALAVLDWSYILFTHSIGESYQRIAIFDTFLSWATLLLIAFSFWRSFKERNFQWLAGAALLAIALFLLGLLQEVGWVKLPGDWGWSTNVMSRAVFITMFLALAVTWALSAAPVVPEGLLILTFTGPQARTPRGRPMTVVFGVNGAEDKRHLGYTTWFRLLQLAVTRRLHGDLGKLDLKELDTDATGVIRIAKQLEYDQQLLFSRSRSMYLLRVPPKHISFERSVEVYGRDDANVREWLAKVPTDAWDDPKPPPPQAQQAVPANAITVPPPSP